MIFLPTIVQNVFCYLGIFLFALSVIDFRSLFIQLQQVLFVMIPQTFDFYLSVAPKLLFKSVNWLQK